jgi:hypothetical protein
MRISPKKFVKKPKVRIFKFIFLPKSRKLRVCLIAFCSDEVETGSYKCKSDSKTTLFYHQSFTQLDGSIPKNLSKIFMQFK